MQELEREQADQSLPTSQPGTPVATAKQSEQDDDPEEIFLNAVAEIDTQPFVKMKRRRAETALTIGGVLEIMYLIGWACFVLFGSIYVAATVPHTLVIVYAKSYPAQITATLDIPTRTLAPVTVTRSQTAPTTGQDYQSARAANGALLYFNGSFTPQTVYAGTVYTGKDGIQVVTDQTTTINGAIPGNPPQFGQASLPAHAMLTGARGNIVAGDINIIGTSFQVRNAPFQNGRDARTYRAVAQFDLQQETRATTQQVQQTLPQAFILRDGEGVYETSCSTKTSADHAIGAEAATLTVTVSSTCQGIAYHLHDLTHKATVAFMTTQPGANYHLAGRVQATIQRTAPLTVSIHGRWAYTFSADYQESLAENIAGATSSQARKLLVQTGVIADASIPTTLPPDGSLIDFLVLVDS